MFARWKKEYGNRGEISLTFLWAEFEDILCSLAYVPENEKRILVTMVVTPSAWLTVEWEAGWLKLILTGDFLVAVLITDMIQMYELEMCANRT